MTNDFITQVLLYLIIFIGGLFISLYIFRSIFNIPSFLRYQRAQVRLLKEIAKHQGVDEEKVQSIITEVNGWDETPKSSTQKINVPVR